MGASTLNCYKCCAGDSGGEDPPFPIPNREVKLSSAEDNARATVCENRSLPAQHL